MNSIATHTLLKCVEEVECIVVSTTYSGKSFWGMIQEIKERGLEDKNIIF